MEVTDKEGKAYNIRGKVGDNLLYLAKRFEVEMEGQFYAFSNRKFKVTHKILY